MSQSFGVLLNIMWDWAVRAFGYDNAVDRRVRTVRCVEELVELAQTQGVPKETLHAVIDVVYDRKVGDVYQELGGSVLTMFALCRSFGVDPIDVFSAELRRVLQLPPEHFTRRNDAKSALLSALTQRAQEQQ